MIYLGITVNYPHSIVDNVDNWQYLLILILILLIRCEAFLLHHPSLDRELQFYLKTDDMHHKDATKYIRYYRNRNKQVESLMKTILSYHFVRRFYHVSISSI